MWEIVVAGKLEEKKQFKHLKEMNNIVLKSTV